MLTRASTSIICVPTADTNMKAVIVQYVGKRQAMDV